MTEKSSSSSSSVRRGLIAFDFDQTIIDANSDLVVVEMIEGEVPEAAKQLFSGDNWTDYMGAIFAVSQHIRRGGGGSGVMKTKPE